MSIRQGWEWLPGRGQLVPGVGTSLWPSWGPMVREAKRVLGAEHWEREQVPWTLSQPCFPVSTSQRLPLSLFWKVPPSHPPRNTGEDSGLLTSPNLNSGRRPFLS